MTGSFQVIHDGLQKVPIMDLTMTVLLEVLKGIQLVHEHLRESSHAYSY